MIVNTTSSEHVKLNSVQTRCIVKGEAQERLFSRNSTGKRLNLIESPIFSNTPCKFVVATPPVCTLLISVAFLIWQGPFGKVRIS